MSANQLDQEKAPATVLDRIGEGLGVAGGYVTAAMVVIVTLNVITRALARWLVPGLFDIIAVMGAVFYSCGVVYAAVKGRHVAMKFVLVRLPSRARRACERAVKVIILVFCALFVYGGATFAWEQWSIGEATDDLGIPLGPFRFVVVVALVLLFLLVVSGKEVAEEEGEG